MPASSFLVPIRQAKRFSCWCHRFVHKGSLSLQDVANTRLRFSVASCTAPEVVCDVDLHTMDVSTLGRLIVSGEPDFTPSDLTHQRALIPSHDNTLVPLDIVHHASVTPSPRYACAMCCATEAGAYQLVAAAVHRY